MINEQKSISILFPSNVTGFRTMSEVTLHDLGIDQFVSLVAPKEDERNLLVGILAKMSDDPRVTQYRGDIFCDIYNNPKMCEEMMEIFDKIDFLREYGSFKKRFDESNSVWKLVHRLEEINDYIKYVEAIYSCLSKTEVKSEGLLRLKEYIDKIYHDNGFDVLKKDIEKMKATTSDLKSVTVGINLNERFEASSIGLISVNNQYFTRSGVIDEFCQKISTKDIINGDLDWKDNYKYHQFTAEDGIQNTIENVGKVGFALNNLHMAAMLARIPDKDASQDVTRYMDRITNHMLSHTVKKIRELLDKYVSITITDITNLIPEFVYYIRFAEYIKKLENRGYVFSRAEIDTGDDIYSAKARELYNLKLITNADNGAIEIVKNDFNFDKNHLLGILTGANRGGKTTITQAIGQLFVLAQGGIFVPAASFVFKPVDCIYTHFPADEDKTVDLGRLGEECQRFRDMFFNSTKSSLILLNETFSTTSFEEGYYIARDSIKAILKKGVRTLYNTHMHKLAIKIDEINDSDNEGKAISLIVKSEEGKRLFKVCEAPAEGMSYAQDIALKYGVTYEMLIAPQNT